ncbi:MAG: ATP-binding protein [Candidatus Riflebacteria bacterium]|nr:ATP-binding protein [Candidatus Riflebacteria bacterium]
MNEELKKKLKYIHLTGLLAKWDQYIEIAREKNLSHVKLLEYIVEEEYHLKTENSRKLRLVKAKIPEKLVMETFPFDRQPKLNQKKILSIYDSFDYMLKHQNVIWIGPTGTGKSGLATAFLIQAINRGNTGRFIFFPELVDLLHKSVGSYSEKEVIKRFADYDCLVIDEVGYVEVEPVQVGLFFTLMQKRHKNKTTLITSNIGFAQWSSFLKNDQLTAALIDRLTENTHVINMKECVSLRTRLK